MYIEPNTVIRILKDCPLDTTYEHTIYFTSESGQVSYFQGLTKYTLTQQSYQRVKRGYMRVAIQAENLYDCNYLMFQNSSFGSKWFYAFIKSVEYVNNATSEIEFEIDVMQTWFFDHEVQKCFVEREHAMNDSVGANTVPESLEIGDYVSDDFDGTNNLGSKSIVVAATFMVEDGDLVNIDGAVYSGIYSGVYYNVFPNTTAGAIAVSELLQLASDKGKTDGIVSVFMMPTAMIGDVLDSAQSYDISKSKNLTSIGSYTPKNNKLFTYPYNFLYVTNLQGSAAAFPYEYFSGDTCTFGMAGDFTCNPGVVLYPTNYKGVPANFDEKMVLTGWPQCTYNTDVFKAWLAQNSASMGVSTIGGALSSGAGAMFSVAMATNPIGATAAVVGAGISIGTQVAGTLAQVYEKSIMPRQSHGSLGGTTLAAIGLLDFAFMHKHIKPEFAEIIDNYFSVYGYATHKVKVPNRSGRPYWNYVKTVGAVITGSVPADDMAKIISIYDRGITFWKNGANVGNYSLDNSL